MIEFFPSTRVFLQIGSVQIMWYAVLIVIGAGIAYRISLRNLKKLGYDQDLVDNLFIGVLLAGIVGARLWYVLFSSDLMGYLQNPISILMTREGGLAIHGGLVAGVIYGYFFARRHNLEFWQWADQIVPNILIAQALGRWGNFVNQEAYGRIVSESYYNYFPAFIKDMMLIGGQYREPTFLYESVGNIIGWVLIVLVLKRFTKVRRGDLTFAYLMWYGVVRFFVEGLRTDSLMLGDSIRMAQLTSVVFVIIGVLGTFGLFRRGAKERKPVLLFDFDGTLMDTEAAIYASFKHTFSIVKPDYTLSDEELLSFVGPTLESSFAKYVDNVDEAVEIYRVYNKKVLEELERPMDGMEALIKSLKEKGYPMGIVSSKRRERIEESLKRTSVADDFEIIVGSEDVDSHKPNPEGIFKALSIMGQKRDQVVYIGDTMTDVKAGQNAGSFTIALVSNEKREEELKNANPNRLIHHLNEIEEILKEDHEWTLTMM